MNYEDQTIQDELTSKAGEDVLTTYVADAPKVAMSLNNIYDMLHKLDAQSKLWLMRKLNEDFDVREAYSMPATTEQANALFDKAEADMLSGNVLTSEEVHQRMESKFPWLCK